MTISMTGFATRRGQGAGYSWVWDVRSVNGKGLDLRLRVPEWVEGLEGQVRTALGKAASRGNINLTLKLSREVGEDAGLRVNRAVLRDVLLALTAVEDEAMAQGLTLAQASQADVLSIRGVMETVSAEADTGPVLKALIEDISPLLLDFAAMRASEGAALNKIISAQLDQVDSLTDAAAIEANARRDIAAATLRENLARVLANAEGVDETRVAQELALLAVKADVTEEIDRLRAHIAAARVLLAETAPVGRKFDFLMQEFMREANTLCSKAQALALTRVGLDLKTVIDQMREQVQNVE
ncbi:MAG: hypothetical protein ACJASV_002956 [Pseudorhodobacter sp.]|jgi:uncharacterized protein (TIGR00255 family)